MQPHNRNRTNHHEPLPPAANMPTEAERSVVGSLILAGDRRTMELATATGIRGHDFLDRKLGRLFDCLVILVDAGRPIDATTLLTELPAMGIDREFANARTIIELVSCVPNTAHTQFYAQTVANAGRRRRLAATIQDALERVQQSEDDTADIARDLRSDLAICETKVATVETIHQGAIRGVERLEEAAKDPGAAGLSRTGLQSLDQTIGRLRAGAMIVVGGRTGTGKTVLGVQTALTTAQHGGRALYFSMEMTADELGIRVACSVGGIDAAGFFTGDYEMLPHLRQSAESLEPLPFVVCDRPGITVDDIAAISRYHHSRAPLSVVIVDYLQLVSLNAGERDRRQGLERVSRNLKQLAKELEIPVMALAQLSRDAEGDKPKLSHLRETGAIEQDADIVILLDRANSNDVDDHGDAAVQLNVAKNRCGAATEFGVKFNGRRSKFSDAFPQPFTF